VSFATENNLMQNTPVKLGLSENLMQFTILVMVNAFVGGMVGMERSVLPLLATTTFGMNAQSGILSFIIVFGISKAISNYFSGKLANKYSRKRVLIIGWLFALPVPWLLMWAPTWEWILVANVFLGINQGLTWSSTVVMKIDLVGNKNRGLAMGLNEFSGYLSVAAVATLTGYIAHNWGIRPYPFYIGIFLSILGMLVSVWWVKDTASHVSIEADNNKTPLLKNIFKDTTWRNKQLGSVTQAGIVNNLNDGMIWGLLPLYLSRLSFNLSEIGMIVGTYPAVWGLGQLVTGKMVDKISGKKMLFTGMLLQGVALATMPFIHTLELWIVVSAFLGAGTAMVYPTFLVTIANNTHPSDRAESMGIFRFWRDSGYAIGAVLTGIIAEVSNNDVAILAIAGLTILSSVVIQVRMKL
jgi:MFS family permease